MHVTYLMRAILYKGTFRICRNIPNTMMTTSRKIQALENLKENPYYNKYAAKIAQLQKEDPDEFCNKIETIGKKKAQKPEAPKEKQYSQLLNPKKKISDSNQIRQESLEKIMKTDLIKDKSSDEIKTIWEQYHIQKDCIAATIPKADFEKLSENGKNYPTFLFALPRTQGYEFMMCQFVQNVVHFTPLLYYQVHKENAPECLTLTHYAEFIDKGIVLMRGEYDKNIIDGKEAQCLTNQLQMYYIQEDPEKRKLLETFTHKPDTFKHTDLIKHIETLSLT